MTQAVNSLAALGSFLCLVFMLFLVGVSLTQLALQVRLALKRKPRS